LVLVVRVARRQQMMETLEAHLQYLRQVLLQSQQMVVAVDLQQREHPVVPLSQVALAAQHRVVM
jgi:hypothetical protein